MYVFNHNTTLSRFVMYTVFTRFVPTCLQPNNKKTMDLLPPVDHDSMEYETFKMSFYKPPAALAGMTQAEVGVG